MSSMHSHARWEHKGRCRGGLHAAEWSPGGRDQFGLSVVRDEALRSGLRDRDRYRLCTHHPIPFSPSAP